MIGSRVVLLARVSLLILYLYACDRGSVFMKENKVYSAIAFAVPTLYVTILGLFFAETQPEV